MNQIARAGLWMTGAIVSFSLMAVAGREVSGAFDTFEIMFYRSLVGVLIVCVALSVLGRWDEINREQLGLHALRNAAHFTGQNLWFYAVTVIPLAQVFALEFTSPIWVLLFAPLVLGERLTVVRMAAGLMGFVGILVVTRPGGSEINAGVIAAALSAICFAATILSTSRLTRRQSVGCVLFYLTVMQLVMGAVATGFDGDIALPDRAHGPWLLAIGLAGLMAHLCVTNALAIAPAAVVVPMDFVRLPAIAVVGLVAYAEAIDPWVIAGALLIFAGNYLNIWSEARKPVQSRK